MPLARIITRFPQVAQELTRQLHARGFAVEVISPEHVGDSSADLLIRLDECSVEEALSTAARIGDRNTNVFVAPGAITGERPPVVPLAEAVNQGTAQSIECFSDTESRAADKESVTAAPDPPARTADEPEVYVYQDAMLSPLERLRLPRIKFRRFALPRLRLPRIETARFSFPRVRVPRVGVPKFTFPQVHLPRIQAPSISFPRLRLAQWAIPRIAFRIPALRMPTISLQLPAMHVRLPKPNLRMKTTNLRGSSWKKAVADFSSLKARLSSVKFHVAKAALRVAQFNWRTPRLHFPNLSWARWRGSIPSAPVGGRFLQSSRSGSFRIGASRLKSSMFWDTAIAFGILAVSILMVAGLLHSKTPLPARLTQQSSGTGQRLPFAALKPALSAGPIAARADNFGKAPRVATRDTTAQAKPSPQITHPAAKLSHVKPKRRVSVGQVKVAQRVRSSEPDADYVADDVVVHYGKKN